MDPQSVTKEQNIFGEASLKGRQKPFVSGEMVADFIHEYFVKNQGIAGPSMKEIATHFGGVLADNPRFFERAVETCGVCTPGKGILNFGYLPTENVLRDPALLERLKLLLQLRELDSKLVHQLRILQVLEPAGVTGKLSLSPESLEQAANHNYQNALRLNLKQLLKAGLVSCGDDLKYSITPQGQDWLSKYSSESQLIGAIFDKGGSGRVYSKTSKKMFASPAAELRALRIDLRKDLGDAIEMTTAAASLCPSFVDFRRLVTSVFPFSANRLDKRRSFSLFDFLDLTAEIEWNINRHIEIKARGRVTKSTNGLLEIPRLLRKGLIELTDLRLRDWPERPMVRSDSDISRHRPFDPHGNKKLLYLFMFPGLKIASKALVQFAKHLGLRHYGGEIPDFFHNRLSPQVLVAHIATKSLYEQRDYMRRIGDSINVRIPKGMVVSDDHLPEIEELCASNIYISNFITPLWRERATFSYSIADRSGGSKAIKVTFQSKFLKYC